MTPFGVVCRAWCRWPLFALLVCLPAVAQGRDPSTRWRTIETPRFRVHYPEGSYAQALQIARAAELASVELIARLGWSPEGPTHIVLSDEEDFAQGYARNVPHRVIAMNAAAPEDISDLSHFDDWVALLVTHELAHIVHVDTVVGLPAAFNSVFGPWLVPNGVQPRWYIEGLATYFESALTAAGRVRSPYFDMFLRMDALEGSPPRLDEISGSGWTWPRGTLPYLYGGYFLDYLVGRYGEEALRDISFDYGSRLLPWAVNLSLERATGRTYPELYADFLSAQRRRALSVQRRIRAQGAREGQRLTDRGERVGPVRFRDDGSAVFVSEPLGEHAVVVQRTDAGESRSIAEVYSGAQISLVPGMPFALVAQLEMTDAYRLYGDLFVVDLDDGDVERLTVGARVREPDVSGQGQVAFVQTQGQHNVIRVGRLSYGGEEGDGDWSVRDVHTVVDMGPAVIPYTPRFAPDGDAIVFSAFADGQRDLYRVDASGGEVERLTADRAHDGGPVFSLDGGSVFFHSDRDGIFDLFRLDLATGGVERVTRVVGGAFHPEPTPDGRAIAYRSYGARGFDLARIELPDGAELTPVEPDGREYPPPVPRSVSTLFPNRAYRSWDTLAPRVWLPLAGVDTQGGTFGASTSGGDVLDRHSYAASAWWGVTSGFAGADVSYRNQQFHPGLLMQAGRRLDFSAVPVEPDASGSDVEEEVWSGSLQLTWPLVTRREMWMDLTTAWEIAWRSSRRTPFPDGTGAGGLPDQGRFAATRLGFSISNARRYPDSISAEEGVRLDAGVRLEHPAVGSEYEALSAIALWRLYLENPWLPRHVLAWRVAGGYGSSSYRSRRLFAIGGLPTRDLVLDFINGGRARAIALRGFPLTPFAGDTLVSTSIEYRFVLWDIEGGYATLPVFARALHGALFFDGAAIGDAPEDLEDGTHASAGIELRLGLVVADSLSTTLRFGFGHGLGRDDVAGYYLALGEVF